MSNRRFGTGARIWLAAGLAGVLAACAHDAAGSGGKSTARWPTKTDVVASEAFTAEGLTALDARMKEAVSSGQLAGLEYVLIKDGKVAAFNVFGNQSFGGPPMTEQTIFRIRSMSKPVTAVAMMQLWEKGLWKPEDPVTKFLPELGAMKVATTAENLDNLVPAKRPASMNEIMTHTAGFGYGLSASTAVDREYQARSPMFEKDLPALVKRAAEIPLLAQPGERWSYSIAVDLQGAIVEKLSGMTFGDYLEKNIFKPLGMPDTGFWLTEEDRPRFATVYTRNGATGQQDVFPDPQGRDFFHKDHAESGGGGLTSTTHDYARFVQMLLNKGELDGKRLLKPETVDLMMQNHIGDLKGVFGGGGFGYGGTVAMAPPTDRAPQPVGTWSWFGIDGTWFWVDPVNKIGFVGMIQRRGGGPGFIDVRGEAPRLVYSALKK